MLGKVPRFAYLLRRNKDLAPLKSAPFLRLRRCLSVVFDSQRHLNCTFPCAHAANPCRQSRHDDLPDYRLTGGGRCGVVIVDGDEQRPRTLVYNLEVPFDVLWCTHRRAERDELAIMLVRGTVRALEWNKRARAWRRETAPTLVERCLCVACGRTKIVLRCKRFGKVEIETGQN